MLVTGLQQIDSRGGCAKVAQELFIALEQKSSPNATAPKPKYLGPLFKPFSTRRALVELRRSPHPAAAPPERAQRALVRTAAKGHRITSQSCTYLSTSRLSWYVLLEGYRREPMPLPTQCNTSAVAANAGPTLECKKYGSAIKALAPPTFSVFFASSLTASPKPQFSPPPPP